MVGDKRTNTDIQLVQSGFPPPAIFWSAANLWHGSSRRQTAAAAAAGRSPPPPAVPTRQERHPARCLPTPYGHGPSEKPVHTRVHSDRGIVAENTPNGFPQFSQNMSEYSESFKYSDNSGNCKIWTAANYLCLRVDSTPQGILSPLRGAQAQKKAGPLLRVLPLIYPAAVTFRRCGSICRSVLSRRSHRPASAGCR